MITKKSMKKDHISKYTLLENIHFLGHFEQNVVVLEATNQMLTLDLAS
jgi:hypothetical protein